MDERGLYSHKKDTTSRVLKSGSSDIPLKESEKFSSDWLDCSLFKSLSVFIKTNQDGILYIKYSTDKKNEDVIITRYYIPSQNRVSYKFDVLAKYVKIEFENKALTQEYFKLQTIFGDNLNSNISLSDSITQDYDSISVRPSDFFHEIALDRRQENQLWNKFGYNNATESTEVVASFGGSFTYLKLPSTLTITSSSTDDSVTGTGANFISIDGINSKRKRQTEIIKLSGTDDIITKSTWLGINRVQVIKSGSNDTNIGNITITATTGGSTQAYIPAGEGITQQAIYFNQAGYKALASWLVLNSEKTAGGASPKVIFKGWVYSPKYNTKFLVFREKIDTDVIQHIDLNPKQPFIFQEGEIFWIEATTDTASTFCSARFSLIEVKNIGF